MAKPPSGQGGVPHNGVFHGNRAGQSGGGMTGSQSRGSTVYLDALGAVRGEALSDGPIMLQIIRAMRCWPAVER